MPKPIMATQIAVGTRVFIPAHEDRGGFWMEVTQTQDWSIYTSVTGIRTVNGRETMHTYDFVAYEKVRVK